jgi:ABC-type multidrug transport system fused ATPase/permease subunit
MWGGLKRQLTMLVIAHCQHRQHADRIIVLDKARGRADHEELLARGQSTATVRRSSA